MNPDHYPIHSTVFPAPKLDISNWISSQIQHMQIKLLILLINWDFLPKFLVKDFLPQASRLWTFETFKPFIDYLLNPIP